MEHREFVKSVINKMLDKGADKAQCGLSFSDKQELNIHSGEISLLRNTVNTSLTLLAIIDNRKGTISINKLSDEEVEDAVNQVISLAKSSQDEPANDIAPMQKAEDFVSGPMEPDLDAMYERIDEFNKSVSEKYPEIILEEVIIDHNKATYYFANSNGVDYTTTQGEYSFSPMFTAKRGAKTSSFNYTYLALESLDKPILECGTVEDVIRQSSEQLDPKTIKGKFIGDIIITPDCITDFIGYITNYLYDYSLISKKSIYLDKLDSQIADPKLTLYSHPYSKELISKYFITSDGFKAQNMTLIKDGILKSYLLSLYGANKTGLDRAVNEGGCYIMEPGDKSFEALVKSVDRGILLSRFSGGNPNDKGDFSGVAKNSYYIENGEIKYPVSEVMISGNLAEMLMSLKDISKERVNFGWKVMPWVQFGNINISGK